ncbi:lipopolysaccharide biosynthesis protein [Corynebacterium glutamicum]|nr:hypothetical protein [Corynebacterium glutamicum]
MQIAYVANAACILGRHISYLKLEGKPSPSIGKSFRDVRTLSKLPLILSLIIALIIGFAIGEGLSLSLLFALGFFALIYSGVQQKMIRAGAIVSKDATPYFWSSIAGQVLLLLCIGMLSIMKNAFLPLWLLAYGASVVFPYVLLSLVLKQEPNSKADGEELGAVKRFGYRLVPLSVAEVVGSRIDRFLIPLLADFAQLGIYTVVVTMTELIAWPIKNYVDSKVPQWNKNITDGTINIFRELTKVSVPILLMSVLIGVSLEIVLVPLFGTEFASGKELIWPLVLAAALHAWSHFGTNISLAAGFEGLANSIPIVAMVFSGVSYLLLIPIFGAFGASWGLVIGYFAACLMSTVAFFRIAYSKKVF